MSEESMLRIDSDDRAASLRQALDQAQAEIARLRQQLDLTAGDSFYQLAEVVPDALVRITARGEYRYANPAFHQIFHLADGAWVGKTIFEAGPPPRLAVLWQQIFREALETGLSQAFTFSIAEPAGERSYEAAAIPEAANGQADLSLILTIRDVTPVKRAEESLKKALARLSTSSLRDRQSAVEAHQYAEEAHQYAEEARQQADELENLFSAMPDVVIVYDANGVMLRANPAARDAFGFDPIGLRHDQNIALLEMRDINGTPLQVDDMPVLLAIQTGRIAGRKIVYRNAAGEDVVVQAMASPVFGENGQITSAVAIWRDITEHERDQQALRESEERFRAVLENSIDAAYRRDLRTDRYDYLSPVIAQVLKVPAAEMADMSIAEVLSRVHPDDRDAVQERLAQAAGQGSGQVEYRFRGNDGLYHWVADSFSFTQDERGEQIFRTGIVRDISEQKQAEDALRESEARFRVMADGTPFIIWVHDSEGKIEFVNQAYTEFFGFTLDQIQRGGWQALVHPEDVDPYVTSFLQANQNHTAYRAEGRVKNKEGQWRRIESHGLPRFSKSGEFLGIAGSSVDITERYEAVQALRESEERFRIALSTLPMTVYILDRNLRYTWIYNPRLGMQMEQILGKRDDEIMPPESAAEFVAVKQGVIDSGKSSTSEISVLLNGELKYFSLTLEPMLDSSGSVTGLIGTSLDITDQRRLEAEQMERMAQLEVQRQLAQHREQERMNIARDLHDGPLQNLIATNMWLASTLEFAGQPLSTRLGEIQENLQEQIVELRDMCHNLRPPTLMPFGLEKSIRSHISAFQQRHPEITIHLALDADRKLLPGESRVALFRIYQELLNNVTKHSRATVISIGLSVSDQEVVLEMQDNGVGFEMLDWIALARQGHLGLIGMRERIELIGGRLEVYTSPGKGTRVRAILPLEEPGE